MAATEATLLPVTAWGRETYQRHKADLSDRSRFSCELALESREWIELAYFVALGILAENLADADERATISAYVDANAFVPFALRPLSDALAG